LLTPLKDWIYNLFSGGKTPPEDDIDWSGENEGRPHIIDDDYFQTQRQQTYKGEIDV